VVEAVVVGLTRQLGRSGHVVEIRFTPIERTVRTHTVRTIKISFDPSNRSSPTDVLGYQLFDDLVARVAPVPLQSTLSPGHAVAVAAAQAFGAMADVRIHFPEPVELESRDLEFNWLPSAPQVLSRIMESLTSSTAAALAKIRRIMQPTSDDVLASWLKVSRPTVRSWTNAWTASEGDARLRVVSRLAQLLEDQLDPEETTRYVYDTPVEALGGSTFAGALVDLDTPELAEAIEGLAATLVW
jgi:hypothetical protein